MKKKYTKTTVFHRLLSRLGELDRRQRRLIGRGVIYLAIIYVGYLFCAGDYGLFRIYRLTNERDKLHRDYLSIAAEAVDCSYRLRRFKTDRHFVEWLARTQYGFSRKNEIIYHIQTDKQ